MGLFTTKTWKNRITEYPNRRNITNGGVQSVVTVERNEGTVSQEGDAFSADNMNALESRIATGIENVGGLVASVFNTSTSYAVGDYCTYEGSLFKFTSTKVAGAWDASKCTACDSMSDSMRDEFNTVNNSLKNLPSATLAIGATSVTITDASITATGLIDVYTDKFGVNPTDIVVTDGQAVLTFNAQTVAVIVKVRCL